MRSWFANSVVALLGLLAAAITVGQWAVSLCRKAAHWGKVKLQSLVRRSSPPTVQRPPDKLPQERRNIIRIIYTDEMPGNRDAEAVVKTDDESAIILLRDNMDRDRTRAAIRQGRRDLAMLRAHVGSAGRTATVRPR